MNIFDFSSSLRSPSSLFPREDNARLVKEIEAFHGGSTLPNKSIAEAIDELEKRVDSEGRAVNDTAREINEIKARLTDLNREVETLFGRVTRT